MVNFMYLCDMKKCELCGSLITEKRNWKTPKHTYCSKECRIKGASIHPLKPRKGSKFNCLKCGNLFYRLPSEIKDGDIKFCSKKCYLTWQKGKHKNSGFVLTPLKGKDNPNWKGGITPINKTIRNSIEYKLWRKAVYERDNYTCQDCGIKSKKGVKACLEAHHKKPFATHPELRLDISNGETLCNKCHDKKPKGRKVWLLA